MPNRVEYMKQWKLNRKILRRRLFDEVKNRPCADCGGWFEPVQMDFDHRDPKQKSFQIGTHLLHNVIKILKEMEKCDVVCANCHRLRTQKKDQWFVRSVA
jgi:hypothetical protein